MPGVVRYLVRELALRADALGLEALPHPAQMLVLAWSARGIIGNGGFRYWYQGKNDAEVRLTIDAFRVLGVRVVADACQESLAAFPAGVVPTNEADRDRAIAAIDWSKLRDAESVVFDVSFEELLEHMGRYVDRVPWEVWGVPPLS